MANYVSSLTAQEIEDALVKVDSGIIPESNTTLVPNSIKVNNIVSMTQADYDALGSYDPNTIYFITN